MPTILKTLPMRLLTTTTWLGKHIRLGLTRMKHSLSQVGDDEQPGLDPGKRMVQIGLITVVLSLISALVTFLILTGLTPIVPRNEVVVGALFVNVALIMVLGTLVGLLLARLGRRMRVTLMIGLVLAWAMPVIAATTVYQWLFAQRFGVVNWVLDRLGWHAMADYSWTSSQMSTFFVIVVLIVWQSIPFVAINLYAATTTIPVELYEAAALDGAGAWRSFTTVTLPFLRPFLYATTFLEIIWVFKAFVQVFAINGGGPDRLTEILPVYAYVEGVGNQHYGMGAAIAVLTILILLGLTAHYLRIVLKQEEDEL